MYQRFVVSLDGSSTAEAVLPYLRPLARRLGAEVELLTVVDRAALQVAQAQQPEAATALRRRAVDRARRYLQQVASQLQDLPGPVNAVVRVGIAPRVIVGRARRTPGPMTVIAMTTRGQAEAGRWTMGSVADRVAHTASGPILLVGPRTRATTSEAPLQTLLVPLDGSPLAEQLALPYAVVLAKALQLAVLLVWVVPSLAQTQAALKGLVDQEQFLEMAEGGAGIYLEDQAKALRLQGALSVTWNVLRGEAAEEIVALASRHPDALIVIGSHGRSGVQSQTMGSVAEKVIRYSGNAVLLVRGNRRAR